MYTEKQRHIAYYVRRQVEAKAFEPTRWAKELQLTQSDLDTIGMAYHFAREQLWEGALIAAYLTDLRACVFNSRA